MLIVSVLLYLLISIMLTLRVYRVLTFSRLTVLFLLVTVSLNILVGEILSLLGALDKAWLFLLLQFIFCLISGLLLWDPRMRLFEKPLASLRFDFKKPRGLDWLLLTLISVILALSLYIGSLVPINNSDSLHTHLPRIYYWIQHGSMASWDAITVTQLNYPINLPLQGVWLFLLGGSERLFYLLPWFALLVTGVLIHSIARQLGTSQRGALFSSLLGISFPVVLLQTFSYQADVFVATLALASVAFLLEYLQDRRSITLFHSLLSLAISLGTKQTAFLFLPFYMVVLLIHLVREKERIHRYLMLGGVFLLLFGVFSSYKFIQNYFEREKLETSMFASYRYAHPFADPDAGRRAATNSLRYLYQSVSVDGLTGQWKLSAVSWRENAFRSLSRSLGLDLEVRDYISEGDAETFDYEALPILNEDAAWFGPLSVILIPVASLVVLFGRNKPRKRYLLVSFVFLSFVFLMVSVLITGWSPTNGRYLILPTLVITPLVAFLLPEKRVAGSILTIALSLAAGYLAFSSLLINDSRPLVTQFSLYSYQDEKLNRSGEAGFFTRAYTYINDRVIEDLALTSPDRRDVLNQTYYENLFYQSSEDIPNIEFVNANVSADETLYLYIQKTIIEYALFGVNKTRDLYPVKSLVDVPTGALVLVDKNLMATPPTDMTLIASNASYLILRNE